MGSYLHTFQGAGVPVNCASQRGGSGAWPDGQNPDLVDRLRRLHEQHLD